MSEETKIDEDLIRRTREQVENPLYQLFMRYGHGNRRWFAVGLFSSMGARFLSLVPPILLGAAIDAIFQDEEAFALPGVPQAWLPTTTDDQFLLVVIGMGIALVGTAVLNFVRMSTLNLFSHRVKHEVRTAAYQQMQRLDMAFFQEVQTGELMSILSNDTNRLEQFLDDMMGQLLQLMVLIVGTALVLLWINWQLALVTLLLIPAGVAFTWWFVRVVEERYDEIRASVGDINSRIENNLNGIEVIKASTTEDYEDDRVEEESYEYFQLSWLALRLNFIYRPGLEALTGIAFVATFIVGGLWLIHGPPGPFTGTLSVGDLVIFLLLTQQLVQPLAQIGNAIDRYEDAKASTKRILGVMQLPINVRDAPDAVDLEAVDGHVEYDDVTFGYDEALPVLEDVSFTAEPGETIGLVGPTGAGKTTIVKLLLRLYDVDEGAVRIDGKDVQDVTMESLRRSMGYVGQDNFLFDGTIRENISYGRFGATDEEVETAARLAQAHDFITQLPNGYSTQIGERGSKLSGGQQQRVAIARTILQDPDIMIFDEATSAVDTETEMLIQQSINDLAADRTTFVIAHRLSTVRQADTILVIEDGRIAERGTHDELIAADGLYANLWRIQAGDLDSLPDERTARPTAPRLSRDANMFVAGLMTDATRSNAMATRSIRRVGNGQTVVRVHCTGKVRDAVGAPRLDFAFGGRTLRDFLDAFFAEYDVEDLLIAEHEAEATAPGWAPTPDRLGGRNWRTNPEGEQTRSFARILVNGTFNEHLDGLDTELESGDRVALMYPFVFCV